MKWLLGLTLPLVALDQVTKFLIVRTFPPNGGTEIIPGLFDLVHVHNTGAAFGLGSGRNLFFIVLSFSALACLFVMAWRGLLTDRWIRTGTALLGAGVVGNLTDRLMRGHVVDFLDFHWRGWHWPAFNVADSCICVAAALYLISSFTSKPASKAR